MSGPNENKDKKPVENLFEIMDGIITQLNQTKKLFIIMIITIMVIPPIAFAITFAFLEQPPFGPGPHERLGPGIHPGFVLRNVPLLISLVWLGIGIRQWFVLSEWTKKYERYKKMQEEIDKKLGEDKEGS